VKAGTRDPANGGADIAAAGEDEETTTTDPGSTSAPNWAVIVAVAAVAVTALLAWWIFKEKKPGYFNPKSDYSAFAGLFIVALALERFLEPFTKFLPPDTDKQRAELDRLVAKAERSKQKGDLVAAANGQALLNRSRAARSVLLWAAASSLAMIAASIFGLLLVRAVAEVPDGAPGPNRFLDLVVTGLAIGAGTKPLHELTTRLTVSKQQAKDPPQTNDTAG
jgi:hypothetical protein